MDSFSTHSGIEIFFIPSYIIYYFIMIPNLTILPQTKNPTYVGLDVINHSFTEPLVY